MKILSVSGRAILDSRKEKTIFVSIKTDVGNFSASAPTGKSTGKHETKTYKKSLEGDIKKLKDFSGYFSEEDFTCFDCLEKIEEVLDRQVGGNTMFALESAVLKAIAKEKGKQVWELIGRKGRVPFLVGNVIGGGKHSSIEKRPDFQEFLLISKDWKKLKAAKEYAEE